jgi:hypothetical protein
MPDAQPPRRHGSPILLADQDRSLWDQPMIARGLAELARAHSFQRGGPFQFQAAIAALHATAPTFEATDWPAVLRLYDVLLQRQPSALVALNRAIAVDHVHGPAAALAALDAIPKRTTSPATSTATCTSIPPELTSWPDSIVSTTQALHWTARSSAAPTNRNDRSFGADGTAHHTPPWQHDDAANAAALGHLAWWLRRLHDATAGFVPPLGAQPRRRLPFAGDLWTHGDVGYPNVVYRDQRIVGLIDWEFAAPSHRCCDPAALLAVSVRGPRPDAPDNDRRALATKQALAAIATGYGMTEDEVRALPDMAAAVLDDARTFQAGSMSDAEHQGAAWRSSWLREHADVLVAAG